MTTALDTETGRIANGLYAPPLVCLAFRDSWGGRGLIPSEECWRHVHEFMRRRLEGGEDFIGFNVAYDWGALIQACPDLAVLIFDAYDAGRVVEIEIVERLTQIATGERGLDRRAKYPSLERLALHYGLPPLVKDDGVRTSYGPLLFAPLSSYSPRQVTYALEDGDATFDVGRRSLAAAHAAGVTDAAIASESRHAFWTHLVNAWGLRTSATRVEDLRRAALSRLAELKAVAAGAGFIREDGKANSIYLQQYVAAKCSPPDDPARGRWVPGKTVGEVKPKATIGRATQTELGLACPVAVEPVRYRERARTEVRWVWDYVPPNLRTKAPRVKPKVPKPPNVATSKVIREDSKDPTLESLAELGAVASVVNLQIPMLEAGVTQPIHTRYRLAGTTRTTSDGDDDATEGSGNQQNAIRNLQDEPHLRVRECYEPRPGHSFGDLDASSLELNTFAQVLGWKCGRWGLAELLNRPGYDPHREFARRNLLEPGMDPDADGFWKAGVGKELRQFAKIPNYGKLGGQGPASLQRYARQQGVKMSLDRAREIDRMWKRDNPDAVFYQQSYIASLERACPRHGYDRPRGPTAKECETCGLHDFEIPGSPGIWRRGVSFTSACNGHFQGLGAQVMKAIGWRLTREAWCDRSSPLWIGYGARLVRFVHDSFFYELPIGAEHEIMGRVAEIAIDGLARGLPNLRAGVEYHATLVDCKAAKRVTDERGRLRAWDPERDGKRKVNRT